MVILVKKAKVAIDGKLDADKGISALRGILVIMGLKYEIFEAVGLWISFFAIVM